MFLWLFWGFAVVCLVLVLWGLFIGMRRRGGCGSCLGGGGVRRRLAVLCCTTFYKRRHIYSIYINVHGAVRLAAYAKRVCGDAASPKVDV